MILQEGKKAPTCSNCQFHSVIPHLANFKLPLHHEVTGQSWEAIYTWAPISRYKPERATFVTPPFEFKTFWKYNSKFPQIGVKLTWWCFQRIYGATVFQFKIFKSVVFRSHKNLGNVFRFSSPDHTTLKYIVHLLLHGSKWYSSSWVWG